MKNLIRKRIVMEVPITSVQGIRKRISLFRNSKEEKAVLVNMALNLTALLMTLPAITALLLVWFEIR